MVTDTQQRVPALPVLAFGFVAGVLLAAVAQASAFGGPWAVALVVLFPFCLAVLTGVAKTTTA